MAKRVKATKYLVATNRVVGFDLGDEVSVPDALRPLMPGLVGLVAAGHLVAVDGPAKGAGGDGGG